MRGFIACISLALFGIAQATGRGCADPRYEYDDKNLVFSPKLKFYEHEYANYIKIYITCKAGYYLYDTRTRDFVDGNKFTSTCKNGKFDPPIGRKRFSCKKKDPVCKLEKSKYRIDDPDKAIFKRGESVEFDCRDGYYLSGVDDTVCMKDGDFLHKIPTCKPKCKKPSQKYLVVDYNRKSFMTGGSIGLDCEKGYKLRRGVEQVRYCIDGEWDPEIEDDLCEREGCESAPKLENGGYKPDTPADKPGSDGWFKVGSKLIYYCKENYYLKGKDWMACARNGEFIYNVPKCIEIRCDQPMGIKNGGFEPEKNSYPVNKYVDYFCDTNYKLNDENERRFCRLNDDGKSASFESAPKCERIECDMPEDISKGFFTPSKGPYYVKDDVDYTCDDGYYLVGKSRAVCLLNSDKMSASFTKAPTCRPILCDQPMAPKNGDFRPREDKYRLGQSVSFRCNKNYMRVGPAKATCEKDTATKGKFTEIPVCKEIVCDMPMPIDKGGFLPVEDEYSIGKSVNYFCVRGYKLKNNDPKRTCTLNTDGESASFPKAPECERIECSKPESIKNGDFSPKRKTHYPKDKVTYTCDPGYALVGGELKECILDEDDESAEFERAPRCKEIICDKPMVPDNGEISDGEKDEYTIGDTVEYKCDFKYYLHGDDSATCKQTVDDTGEFTDAPDCKEILCDEPMELENGKFGPKQVTYSIGDDVTYKCDDNYKLVGTEKAICEKTGRRTAKFTDAPTCKLITCDEPMELENGDFIGTPDAPFTVGEIVRYKCDPGFEFATDFTTSRCKLADDKMSAEFTQVPKCRRVYCTLPGKLRNGDISPDKDRYVVDESVTFTCDKCYSRDGTMKATCQQNGKFDRKMPSCDIVKCSKKTIPYPSDSTFRPLQQVYECGDVVEFECHEAFNLKNDESTTCQDNGDWSIDEKAFCDPIICSRPDLNDNVRVRPNRDEYPYLDEIEYGCKPGYSVVETDRTRAICQKNGQFSNPSVTCKQNKCGQPPLPKNGGITKDTEKEEYLPDNEVEYVCDEWYSLEGYGFNKCDDDGNWDRPAPKCAPPSCKGYCFSNYIKTRPCQCDYKCYDRSRKDCCSDREKWCHKESCADRCGKTGSKCSCDRNCSTRGYLKCCRDYYQACPGKWYMLG